MSEEYTLVLVRHGESEWNKQNRFTGWVDVPLAPSGIAEAEEGAKLIQDAGLKFDVAYTSVLKRAIKTLWLVLEGTDQMYIPVKRSWRLNERMYGDLQGLDKMETVEKHGKDQVHIWRRSYATPPPTMDRSNPLHPCHSPHYAALDPALLPDAECLKDTVERVLPFWNEEIAPTIKSGKRVLIAAHGNSLRALVMYLDKISEEEISGLNIPTGVPLVYKLNAKLEPITQANHAPLLSGYYLGDADEAAQKAAKVAAQTGAK